MSPFALQISGDWEGAAREWAEHGFPYETAMALADSPNENDLRAAAASFGALGAISPLEMVRQRLRQIGAVVPRGPHRTTRNNPAQLTSREIEVLAMIERGMTDAEIARTIFVSTRTVNHHVSSILIKLDVKSRTEAGKRAAELRHAQRTTTGAV
jgi:DNA-binding NarL/FixJ family response regulator